MSTYFPIVFFDPNFNKFSVNLNNSSLSYENIHERNNNVLIICNHDLIVIL